MDIAESTSYQQFLAIDGDRVGETLERLILLEDLAAVRRFSDAVAAAVRTLKDFLVGQGCDIIFAAGDGLLAASRTVLDLSSITLRHGELTFSIGAASRPAESLLALKVAKGLGRCRIIARGGTST
jgi:hypothetical protein